VERTDSSVEASTGLRWRPAAHSLEELLKEAGNTGYVRSLVVDPPMGGPNPNLPGFLNSGGLLGKGVCWWYSRFTRNALYLACFLPDEEPPVRSSARKMAVKLMKAREVVAVPGYGNLRDFSLDYEKEIRRVLENHQLADGVFRFAWINGLSGSSMMAPGKLEAIMDDIHEMSSRGMVYAKFQTPGLDAHSILVTGMETLPHGYRVRYLDSNHYGERILEYGRGDRFLVLEGGMTGIPYPQRGRELERMKKVLRSTAIRLGTEPGQ